MEVLFEQQTRYRVPAEYKNVHQIVIEAASTKEADYFANHIDLDKWQFVDATYEMVDAPKDFFAKKVRYLYDYSR